MRNPLAAGLLVLALLLVGAVLWLVLGGDGGPDPLPPEDGGGATADVPKDGGSAVPGPDASEPPPPDPEAALDAAVADLPRRTGAGAFALVDELTPLASTEAGVQRIIERLRATTDPETAALYVAVLARSQLASAEQAVIDAARGDAGEAARVPGLLSLAYHATEESTGVLAGAVEDPNDRLATAALAALAGQNTGPAHELLARTLRRTTDPERRRWIWSVLSGEGLSQFEDDGSLVREMRIGTRSRLVELPGDPASARAMEQIALDARGERSMAGRVQAAGALLVLRGEATTAPFLELFEEMRPMMRHSLLLKLEPHFSDHKLPGLIEITAQDEVEENRMVLAHRLADVAMPEHLEAVKAWRERETSPAVKEAVEMAIRRIEERHP